MNWLQTSITGMVLAGLTACSPNVESVVSEAMKQELEQHVSGLACIMTRAFPMEVTRHSSACYDCDKLIEAGLVEKETYDDESDSNSSTQRVRYFLTDIGEGAYVPGTDTNFGPDGPKFCFGAPRLVNITRVFGPVSLNPSEKHYGIYFRVQLDNPDPYLFDPRAKTLKIAIPTPSVAGSPVFYPEQNVTAIVDSLSNDFYLDASMTIGPAALK